MNIVAEPAASVNPKQRNATPASPISSYLTLLHSNDLIVLFLSSVVTFFRHLKLESLTQIPASNDENIYKFVFNPYSAGIEVKLTSKVDPRPERIKHL